MYTFNGSLWLQNNVSRRTILQQVLGVEHGLAIVTKRVFSKCQVIVHQSKIHTLSVTWNGESGMGNGKYTVTGYIIILLSMHA